MRNRMVGSRQTRIRPRWLSPPYTSGLPEYSADHAADEAAGATAAAAIMMATAAASTATSAARLVAGIVAGACRRGRDDFGKQSLVLQLVEIAALGIAACGLPAGDD